MVQGSIDSNILGMKNPTKSVKVPTEEQKRLAKLSQFERIDNLEDGIIKQMVEITNHSYEECAMELRGADLNMETAITNLLEGKSEQWITTKKKSRPEKKIPKETQEKTDISKEERVTQRGGRSSTRGSSRGGKKSGGSDLKSTERSEDRTRDMRPTRGTVNRGRGGKRQLPPRMDRHRCTRDESDSRSRDPESRSRDPDSRSRDPPQRSSYRRDTSRRDEKRPCQTKQEDEPDWSGAVENGVEAWDEENVWGGPEETDTAAPTDAWNPAPEQTTTPETKQTGWPIRNEEKPVNGSDFSGSYHSAQLDVNQRKRPAYTQAFNQSSLALSNILATSTHIPTSATSNSFPFSQGQTSELSNLGSDFGSRHEQAKSDNILKIQEALQKNTQQLPAATGRKISVEQLFQMHGKSAGIGGIDETRELSPSSPPTSSTSSTNSTRRNKRHVHSRVIPSEPVEMPGNTLEGLDLQFGSIGFFDSAEDTVEPEAAVDHVSEKPLEPRTPSRDTFTARSDKKTKSDAATSTTPHLAALALPEAEQPVSSIQPVRERERDDIQQVPLREKTPEPVTPTMERGHKLESMRSGPPNLPPPNIDNIRTASSLITSTLPDEKQQQPISERAHVVQQTASSRIDTSVYNAQKNLHDRQKDMARHLPPGVSVYPAVRNSAGVYNSPYDKVQQPQLQYDMSRYSNSSNSFEHQRENSAFTSTNQQVGPDKPYGRVMHEYNHAPVATHHHGNHQQQQQQQQQNLMSSVTSHQGNSVSTGLGSGIVPSTSAGPQSTGMGTTGYPPLMGTYYPIPHHYPSSLYANYYTHFNPVNFAPQSQSKQATNVYPTAAAFGGTGGEGGSGTSFPSNPYDEYKEMYGGNVGSNNKPHSGMNPHNTVSSSNEYNKLVSEKNMFNMGYLQYPNFFPTQAAGSQAAALMQQRNIVAQEPLRNQTGSLGAQKQYWSHR